ncbi:MAG: ACP S-malonyltransferase [Thermoleophilia bacterium]|nr:ACP S-malonyltransferase [Thermoleophilia bacterium]
MPALAFLYPGQGSQKVGMGAELLAEEGDLLAHYLTHAEAASGLPIRRYCLEGPPEALTRTDVAQPALFSVSLALTDAARSRGLRPDVAAGHSLGEYTAAAAVRALRVEDAMELVCLRGRLMAEIQSEAPGAMAAVIGLPAERLRELCEQAAGAGRVSLANLNSPTQVVVSGEDAAVERLMELARDAGAARVVRLQVGAAFHSELMRPAQERMAAAAAEVAWSDPEVPLAANAWGRLIRTGDDVREALIAQIASPVDWVGCVQALVATGCDTALELGPGRVLQGLVRQIAPDVDIAGADASAGLAAFVEARPALAGA